MTWSDIGARALDIILPLLAVVLTAVAGAAFRWLLAKAANISKQTVRDAISAGLAELQRVVTDAIAATNQMLVNDLKEASSDGKLTKDEMRLAMSNTLTYVRTHLGGWAMTVLQAAYGPIGEWLESYVEAQIGKGKAGELAVPLSPLATPPEPGPSA